MTHSLMLGSLLLTEDFPEAEHGYAFAMLAEGASFGVAQGVQEIVRSLLADGDRVRITRYGNRQVTFRVEITGPSLDALAQGEAALRRELGRPTTLTWQAPDLFAAPTVFEVITSEMSQSFNDLDELRRRRIFELTLTCAPFARSAEPVVIEPLPPAPAVLSTFTVSDADTTSGWSGEESVVRSDGTTAPSFLTATDQGSFVRVESIPGAGFSTSALYSKYNVPPVSMDATPFLIFVTRLLAVHSHAILLRATIDGAVRDLTPVVARAESNGTTTFVFNTGGGTLSAFAFGVRYVSPTTSTTWIDIYDVTRSNTMPQISNRQITRILEPVGTERTPASIHVASADGVAPLTMSIVHTCPVDGSGYSPPLRRWRVSGQTVTTDTSLVSGAYESITGTGVTFEIPTSSLPEGGYVLVARMSRSASGTATIAWSTSTLFPDSVTAEGFVGGNESIVFPSGAGWAIYPIIPLSLPSVRTKAGKVRVIIQAPETGGPTVYIDEAWLFRMDDDCDLSIVSAAYANLWLNSPGVDGSVPTAWVGNGADTRVHPGTGLKAMGAHVLSTKGTAVFTAALADTPKTDVTFHPRWHSNAAL